MSVLVLSTREKDYHRYVAGWKVISVNVTRPDWQTTIGKHKYAAILIADSRTDILAQLKAYFASRPALREKTPIVLFRPDIAVIGTEWPESKNALSLFSSYGSIIAYMPDAKYVQYIDASVPDWLARLSLIYARIPIQILDEEDTIQPAITEEFPQRKIILPSGLLPLPAEVEELVLMYMPFEDIQKYLDESPSQIRNALMNSTSFWRKRAEMDYGYTKKDFTSLKGATPYDKYMSIIDFFKKMLLDRIDKSRRLLHPDLSIRKDGRQYLQDLFMQFHRFIVDVTNEDELINRIQEVLPGELAKHSISEIQKERTKAIQGGQKFSLRDSIFAMYEYLIAELIELGGNVTRDRRGGKVITPKNIDAAIESDEELRPFVQKIKESQ